MYTTEKCGEYKNLILNFNFINDNSIKNYYDEMNSHKWVIKNDSPDKFNLYLDYFNNNVNNSQENQETIFQEQQSNNNQYKKNYKKFKNCAHINKILGKPTRIKQNDKIIKNNEKCNICFKKFKAGEYKRELPNCGNFYHKKCIDKWLKIDSRCPICRNKLL